MSRDLHNCLFASAALALFAAPVAAMHFNVLWPMPAAFVWALLVMAWDARFNRRNRFYRLNRIIRRHLRERC